MPNIKAICEPDTPQWLEMRKKGIGASEAAAVVGLSPWATPLEIFLRKTGQLAEKEQTDAMRMGHLLEPVIWTRFGELTGIPVVTRPVGLIPHKQHDFILATPDAFVQPENEDLQVGESKSTSWRRAAEMGENPEDVPMDWLVQVQQQLAVTELEVARMAVLLDGRTLLNFRIERNQNLIDALIDAETEFWERIKNNDPPPPNFTHTSMPRLIKELFGNVSEHRVVDLSEEASQAVIRAMELKAQIKKIEEELGRVESTFKYEIGDAPIGVLPGRTDLMVKRRFVPETHVAATTKRAYTVTQAVKYDGRIVATMRQQSKFEAIELLLYGAGYNLTESEASGSKYYACDGKPPVRVADHDPNEATAQWIDQHNAVDVRVDDSHEAIADKLKSVL